MAHADKYDVLHNLIHTSVIQSYCLLSVSSNSVVHISRSNII